MKWSLAKKVTEVGPCYSKLGIQNYSHRSSVLPNKFYWNMARAHYLHIICVITCLIGCF